MIRINYKLSFRTRAFFKRKTFPILSNNMLVLSNINNTWRKILTWYFILKPSEHFALCIGLHRGSLVVFLNAIVDFSLLRHDTIQYIHICSQEYINEYIYQQRLKKITLNKTTQHDKWKYDTAYNNITHHKIIQHNKIITTLHIIPQH